MAEPIVCSSCRYFVIGFGDRMGSCRRFPVFQTRSVSEWCGEHKLPDQRKKKEAKDDQASA